MMRVRGKATFMVKKVGGNDGVAFHMGKPQITEVVVV